MDEQAMELYDKMVSNVIARDNEKLEDKEAVMKQYTELRDIIYSSKIDYLDDNDRRFNEGKRDAKRNILAWLLLTFNDKKRRSRLAIELPTHTLEFKEGEIRLRYKWNSYHTRKTRGSWSCESILKLTEAMISSGIYAGHEREAELRELCELLKTANSSLEWDRTSRRLDVHGISSTPCHMGDTILQDNDRYKLTIESKRWSEAAYDVMLHKKITGEQETLFVIYDDKLEGFRYDGVYYDLVGNKNMRAHRMAVLDDNIGNYHMTACQVLGVSGSLCELMAIAKRRKDDIDGKAKRLKELVDGSALLIGCKSGRYYDEGAG